MMIVGHPARGDGPDRAALADRLGGALLAWDALVLRLTGDIGAQGSWSAGGATSGPELRFKRGSRPLTTLTPGDGAFTALVVLGREEAARAAQLALTARASRTFTEARSYHDGRWLFLEVVDDRDVADVLALIIEKLPGRLRASLGAPRPASVEA